MVRVKQQIFWTLLLWLSLSQAWAAPPGTTGFIRVDQFGYFQNARKVAVIVDPQVGSNATQHFTPSTGAGQYQVRRWADNAVVFSGTIQVWKDGVTQQTSGDKGWWFDFSTVNTPGSYYVFDVGNNVGSYRFEIGDGVYNEVLRAALRTFFYQRINQVKQPPYADSKWTDAAIHEAPGQDRQARSRWAKTDATTARDVHGGWMDAGDMNKYVTFAEEPVVLLLDAYRQNPSVFGDNLNIPESGNGVADILDEVKYELDFLRRMQDATGTGGLLLKVGVDNWNPAPGPPSADRRPRYYLPECTSSTVSGAAMFAAAAATFRQIPALNAYAQDMIARAERAFARAQSTTNGFTTFQTDCDDLDIKAGDADKPDNIQKQSALVAAIYLFEATGKAEYKAFVESRYAQMPPVANSWFGPYLVHVHSALLRYAANPAASPAVASAIRTMKSQQNNITSLNDYNAKTDLYRAHMPDAQYHWGSSQVRANCGIINLDFANFNINATNKAQYREVASEYLHWFHGVNAQGKVMLSNMYAYGAEDSQNEIYHVWYADGTEWDNALTSAKGPLPGFNTGGPNHMNQYDGTLGYLRNEPLQKRYKDWNTGFPENSWIFTEVAIYNQAAYINMLSRLMVPSSDPSDTEPPTAPSNLVASDLSPYSVKLTWTGSVDNRGVTAYEIYQNGTKVAETPETTLNLTTLSPATNYTFTVRATDFSANRSGASNAVAVTTPAPSPNDFVIYSDAYAPTIQRWSWSATDTPDNTNPVKLGQRSVRADITADWGAVSLRNSDLLTTANYPGGIQFWFYGTEKPIRVLAYRTDTDPDPVQFTVSAEPNLWTLVRIPWHQLGNLPAVKRFSFMDGSGSPQTFYLDDIRLVAGASTPDTQAPTAPTSLTTTQVTATSMRLTWTASTDNAGVTSYEILRSGAVIATATGTAAELTGLSCNSLHELTVRAKDAAGNVSPTSNTIYIMTTACTDAQAPTVPANLATSNVTKTGLTLSWAASTDNVAVTGYEVFRNGTLISNGGTATSLGVTGLTCNTSYTFSVLAKDAMGNRSAQSSGLAVTTAPCSTTDTPPTTPPSASELIYDETLNTNWQEWGWSITSNYANANPVKVNTKSLAVQYTDGWGGWAITRATHFIPSAQTVVRFWLYATTNKPIGVCTGAENEGNLSPYVSFTPTPNQWQEVVITMAQLANPAKIKRLTIQSQASGTNLIYVDNVRLEPAFSVAVSNVATTGLRLSWSAVSGATAYDVYRDGTLLSGNVVNTSINVTGLTCGTAYRFAVVAKNGQGNVVMNSVPASATTTSCPGSSTAEMIYDDAFSTTGWDDWSWGLARDYNGTGQVKVGQKSAALTFEGWGAWSIFRKTPLIPTAQTTLKFWLYATTNKTLALTLYAENETGAGTTVNLTPTPNQWQEVSLTMAQLGNLTKIKRLVLNLPAPGPAPVFLDQVRFETPGGAARLAATLPDTDVANKLTVSPNPSDGPVRVAVLTDQAETATLSVVSLAGTLVYRQSVQTQAGANEFTLPCNDLASGTYLVQYQTLTKRLAQRLVLVK